MNAFLILITIGMFALQTLSMKLIKADSLRHRLLVNAGFTLAASVGLLLFGVLSPGILEISTETFYYGILFGFCFTVTIIFYNLAISAGPLSLTAFYFSASMLIPALAGILLFREPLRLSGVAAVVLFLGAFYFINVNPSKEKKSAGSKKWYLYCCMTFLFNGLLAVIQKSQQAATHGAQSGGLMLVGFCSAFVFYLLSYLALYYAQKTKLSLTFAGERAVAAKNRLPMLLLAAGSVTGNLILTYLSGVMPGSYLFPLVQGSIIVSVTACSLLFFKEKLSRFGKIGITLGVIAIVVINL